MSDCKHENGWNRQEKCVDCGMPWASAMARESVEELERQELRQAGSCSCHGRVHIQASFLESIAMTKETASLHYTEWELTKYRIVTCTTCGQEWYIIPTGEKHRCTYCVYLESMGIEIPQYGDA